MKKIAILSAVALIGAGSIASTDAEARSRRNTAAAVTAGVVGGLAAGALIGAASNAYATPYAYGTSYGYAPATTYYAPAPRYRTTRVVRSYSYSPDTYEEYVPARRTRTTRVVRSYQTHPATSSWGSPAVTVGYRNPGYSYYAW